MRPSRPRAPRALRALLLAVPAVLALLPAGARAQDEGLLQVGDDLHEFLQRQHTAGRLPGAFVDAQPLSAYEARRLLDTLATRPDTAALSPTERALLDRYRGVRPGPGAGLITGRIPGLYRDGEHPFSASGEGYRLVLEPLLYFAAGPARQTETAATNAATWAWQNTRGARAAGSVGRHLFFEARLEENQRRPVVLAHDAARTAPRLGDVKLDGETAYDYWRATGVVGYHDRFLEVRFGRDRNRWGYGTNSLVLSDYAPAYDQLQVRAHVGPVEYLHLVSRFTHPDADVAGAGFYPSQYGAFHRLALNLPARLQLSLFESVIFATDTTDGRRSGLELGYLNPVIFFRALEADLGSPDNVLLGGGLAWVPVGGVRTYGEVFLDELQVGRLFDDWWANKWAFLVGAHAVVPGVRDLDVRVEYARLRPYLYSHRTRETAYVHFNDGLGHPAGPNAEDLSLFARYRPTPALTAALNLALTRRGRNTDSLNYGADPTLSYDSRIADFGIVTLQGVRQTALLAEARVGYEVVPGLVAEGALVAERVTDGETGRFQYLAGFVQLRWGLPFRSERW